MKVKVGNPARLAFFKEKYMSRLKSRRIFEKHIGRKLSRYEVIHHRDGNPNNMNLNNLELLSLSKHSCQHMKGRQLTKATKTKLQKSSRIARPGAKLFIHDVYDVRKMLADGIKQWLIALAFGVNRRTVSAINTRAIWSWV